MDDYLTNGEFVFRLLKSRLGNYVFKKYFEDCNINIFDDYAELICPSEKICNIIHSGFEAEILAAVEFSVHRAVSLQYAVLKGHSEETMIYFPQDIKEPLNNLIDDSRFELINDDEWNQIVEKLNVSPNLWLKKLLIPRISKDTIRLIFKSELPARIMYTHCHNKLYDLLPEYFGKKLEIEYWCIEDGVMTRKNPEVDFLIPARKNWNCYLLGKVMCNIQEDIEKNEKDFITQEEFNAYFIKLDIVDVRDGIAYLSVDDVFVASAISINYLKILKDYFNRADDSIKDVEISVVEEW